ncbi:MAG: thiamine phosphate synthase, partial [Deltaproteobacteria bacterium]|nr:thiamine phosphate synthase [Deltaproteobacteria bacterium]
MAKTVDFNLYAITDGGNDKDLIDKVKASLDGGLRAIQLREKGLGGADLLTLAEKVSRITKDYKAKLFINDRADVARLIDADGLHLT